MPVPDELDAENITDEQWLAGHRYLMSLGAVPDKEAAYLFAPDRDPATVDPADLTVDRDPDEPDEVAL
jgi:hypothetical protein